MHASICVFSWGVFAQAMYISICTTSERGILQAFRSPAERPPSGYLPPTGSSSSLPLPGAALRQDASSCSHSTLYHFTQLASCHHYISSVSNPALPLLVSDFGPNRPTRSHICHGFTHTQTHAYSRWLKKTLLWESRILYNGCFKGWCSTAVSINAFNLSNSCCLGGRSDSYYSWH